MPRKKSAKPHISDESAELKSRLEESEETLSKLPASFRYGAWSSPAPIT
jgi:hypothetical protein